MQMTRMQMNDQMLTAARGPPFAPQRRRFSRQSRIGKGFTRRMQHAALSGTPAWPGANRIRRNSSRRNRTMTVGADIATFRFSRGDVLAAVAWPHGRDHGRTILSLTSALLLNFRSTRSLDEGTARPASGVCDQIRPSHGADAALLATAPTICLHIWHGRDVDGVTRGRESPSAGEPCWYRMRGCLGNL